MTRHVAAILTIAALIAGAASAHLFALQSTFDVKELADYRLRPGTFKQFSEATSLIAAVTGDDPRFADAPLFSRDVALSGEVSAMATDLETRLQNDTALAGALRSSNMSAREYTKFAIALIAAHLAHGFVKAGVLRAVPAGTAADNVEFVATHLAEVAAVLEGMGITD